MHIKSIISGGQTGVDRAALDTAIHMAIPHAGWCPAGRRAEDGRIPDQYDLRETPDSGYLQRTEWNVRDSDATLIVSPGELEGGTAATYKFALQYNKPCLIINPDQPLPLQDFHEWLQVNGIKNLNIAGPRESKLPGIYDQTMQCLLTLLKSS